jgi:hypothetical protein
MGNAESSGAFGNFENVDELEAMLGMNPDAVDRVESDMHVRDELKIDYDSVKRKFTDLVDDGYTNPLYYAWEDVYKVHQAMNIPDNVSNYTLTCRKEGRPMNVGDVIMGASQVAHFDQMQGRSSIIDMSAWAIPSPDAIEYIAGVFASVDGNRELVEIGSGKGYWLRLLRDAGITCTGYDILEQSRKDTFSKVQHGDETSLANHTNYHVMLCWPPQKGHKGEGMDERVLKLCEPTSELFYIGEPIDGSGSACSTGTQAFFDALSKDWELVNMVEIPKWPGMFDNLYHYRRRIV